MDDDTQKTEINQAQQYTPAPHGFVPLPNATAVLVLGILSIVLCWCYGVVGLVLGIIALVLANKASTALSEDPKAFLPASIANMKAGKVCAIIGVSLSGLYILILIIYIAFIGSIASSVPWEMWKYY